MENPNAFPITYTFDGYKTVKEGMSLRDYNATTAMMGLLSNPAHIKNLMGDYELPVPSYLAELSYEIADAMLKQREL